MSAASGPRPRPRRQPAPGAEPPVRITHEWERDASGARCRASTVFLVGPECPFSCVFCDLWRFTLEEPAPSGALTRQLAWAVDRIPHDARLKLYNASNFFDDRAVPPDEDEALIAQLDRFEQVVVECHPHLVGDRCYAFAECLSGTLQVALGLETVHPEALARLDKGMTVDTFDAAVSRLRARGIGVRVFVLFGTPFIAPSDQGTWTRRSIDHALAQGADQVSVIPVRPQDELRTLGTRGLWEPPTLEAFEQLCDTAIGAHGWRVQADLWDLDQLDGCPACRRGRETRLAGMNRDGRPHPPLSCARCHAGMTSTS